MHDLLDNVLSRLADHTVGELNCTVLERMDQTFLSHACENFAQAIGSEMTEFRIQNARQVLPGNYFVPVGCRGPIEASGVAATRSSGVSMEDFHGYSQNFGAGAHGGTGNAGVGTTSSVVVS